MKKLIIFPLILLVMAGCKKSNNDGTSVNPGVLTDKDGNTYRTVTIGTQIWMAENLKTTKYNDGTSIPLVTDSTEWATINTPAYCWYNNDSVTNKNTYGALYNWFVINTGKLAPSGWHVPTDEEWTILTDHLGGLNNAGGKMKEAGTAHWNYPNDGADNSSGFTALPGGKRYITYGHGRFNGTGTSVYFWSSTPKFVDEAWARLLTYDWDGVTRIMDFDRQTNGGYVRCVKD
jgi:uncharacterized protein (TIGR02145 family)